MSLGYHLVHAIQDDTLSHSADLDCHSSLDTHLLAILARGHDL